jgi:hypothetical protein
LKWNISNQLFFCLDHIEVGVEAGAQDVPDPICPMPIVFAGLEPIRIAICSPERTMTGPCFEPFMPGMASILFDLSLPDGFEVGSAAVRGIFIEGSRGLDSLAGVGDGFCMPGMVAGFVGVGSGEGALCPLCCANTVAALVERNATTNIKIARSRLTEKPMRTNTPLNRKDNRGTV